MAGYQSTDFERALKEQRGSGLIRSEFARDRARVLHSAAFRRLGAKTQVLSPEVADFARTRLTHSLEVAQIGRELGRHLGLNPDLVDMACLAHDLGHPPYGHNGERALNEWAADIGGFEGNAQTLRVVSRLEPKVVDSGGKSYGLNLCRASLDALCKYPWGLTEARQDSGADRNLKYGYYADDVEVFTWFRSSSPAQQKSMEAQVMDVADDIAYSVHDFEDAIVEGFLDPSRVHEQKQPELLRELINWAGSDIEANEVIEAIDRLMQQEYWPAQFGARFTDLARLKNLTSALIGSFVNRIVINLRALYSDQELVRYEANLQVPREVRVEMQVLKGIVASHLMTHSSRQAMYQRQRDDLQELASELLAGGGDGLEPQFSEAFAEAADDSARKRVVVDQVSSLTDRGAKQWLAALQARA